MDCETARFLIDAFHDDELEPADAARLLGHLARCSGCEAQHRLTGALKSACQRLRVPECQAKRSSTSGNRRLVAAVTLFAGAGVALGAAGSYLMTAPRRVSASPTVSVREVEGEVFCLRCAMESLLPETSFAATAHRPVLRTADGRLLSLVGAPGSLPMAEGCTGRRVCLVGRLHDDPPALEVLQVRPQRVPPVALTLNSTASGQLGN